MGHVVGQERSSRQQQNLDGVREKTPQPWIEKAVLLQGKHRVRHSFSQPYLDRGFELTENGSAENVQSRSSGHERKPQLGGRACDDNELVKHMSNLPGFLQQVEKENTVQVKALNFGVLDWRRLEKWKYTERMPGKLPKKASPSGDPFLSASGLPKLSQNLRKQPSSRTRYPSLSYSGKQPVADGLHFSSPQQQQPPQSLFTKSSKEERGGNYEKGEENVECLKSKGKETCNQYYHTASIRIARQQNHFEQTGKYFDQICSKTIAQKSKRTSPKKMMSEREASSSSSKQCRQKIALLSPNRVGVHGKKSEMGFDEEKLTSECYPAAQKNIVLLVPKDFHEKSCSESSQFTESRTSDAQLSAVSANRLSDFCSPELYSREFSGAQLSADIPHSCPLPSSPVEPHDLLASHAADACPNADSITSTSSEAKFSDTSEETSRPSIFVEASNNKQAGVGEQSTVKGRSPSPTRRFSFNLGRMSRSFSFKESSSVPELSSTYTTVKSGPVRPEVAPNMDNFDKDQANASSRSRSSPLRRLLDPLLKHKTSSDAIRPLNGSKRSVSPSPTGTRGPPQDRKPEAPTFQALLQLTFKNGLPFFRLVVENRKDMLAAAVKRLPTSEKIDACMIYSFYSVHEIKKKSMNWISHGSKSKSCSLGYSIIGQMKISNVHHLKVNKGETVECDARECVLYGVDPAQVDKQMLAFVPNKEIAAIVVKNSGKRVDGGEVMNKNQWFPRYRSPLTSESQENDSSHGTVVILPGAVHGTPIKGAPSSLISRWTSGGLCDCGGWDVGCKLRILADSRKSSNTIQESTSSSVDHFNLFMQGGEQKGRPVFSLKPFSDEFYSIELDPSISLLEAFATSVAYLTSRKFPEIVVTKGQSEAEHVPEAYVGRKTPSVQEQSPAKFVTCPPLSPVGRI